MYSVIPTLSYCWMRSTRRTLHCLIHSCGCSKMGSLPNFPEGTVQTSATQLSSQRPICFSMKQPPHGVTTPLKCGECCSKYLPATHQGRIVGLACGLS